MKMIGLIGGMRWESSAEYYRILNQGIRAQRGSTASAKCLLWSFDFSDTETLQHQKDWDTLNTHIINAAQRLENAGAEILLLCTNTMHKVAPAIQSAINIPLIHIADPTAERIKAARLRTVGLLGTAFTMEQDFYKGRLTQHHGLNVLIPNDEDRATVHHIIYNELVAGKITTYQHIIAKLVHAGAEAIILGCTEIMLLVGPEDSTVPLFDTTELHAQAAIEAALT
ncbi:aspartate/glutamate racemase family protein [Neokomagataea anthophila]|uniref:Aspartate/glutamate racemase family protein n=1 Tax=Neokomagataea anthophila TaxID=2826925 RepID=A0ABS5E3I4_9PROT|nr:aspartate/glutamate racemase family protein [Neokomagataea anthophila]MBR0558469.1 aspartate/glutamate racemase family protein [Neokomagataea anthophila]